MTALETALERYKAKHGPLSTDLNGGHCGRNSRLDQEHEDYDPEGFAEERGEYWADVERGN